MLRIVFKIVMYLIMAAGVGFAALVVSCAIILNDACSEEELVRAPSPSGKYMATIVEKNCGATTAFSYHPRLGKAGSGKPDVEVGWFSRLHDNEHYGRSPVALKWQNDTRLVISYL